MAKQIRKGGGRKKGMTAPTIKKCEKALAYYNKNSERKEEDKVTIKEALKYANVSSERFYAWEKLQEKEN